MQNSASLVTHLSITWAVNTYSKNKFLNICADAKYLLKSAPPLPWLSPNATSGRQNVIFAVFYLRQSWFVTITVNVIVFGWNIFRFIAISESSLTSDIAIKVISDTWYSHVVSLITPYLTSSRLGYYYVFLGAPHFSHRKPSLIAIKLLT